MNKLVTFISLSIAICFFACNLPQKEENSNSTIKKGEVGKDSEMTLLMRDMFNNYQVLKDSIIQNKKTDRSLFSEVHRIHRVSPTDSTILGSVFESYSNSYLASVDSLLLAEKDRETYFNLSVQSCANCHNEFCPGPVDKIMKLKIKPKQEKK